MRFAAVLFDLDGVLIDSQRAWHRVVSRGRREWGYPRIGADTFRATFGQGVEADRRQFFPRQTVAEIRAFYEQAFPEEIDAVAVVPGAIEVLDRLGGRGLLRAVVTNTPVELAGRVIAAKGLDARLEAVAAAGEAPEKPAPDLLLLALSRLGVEPSRALFVGDSPSDLQAARAAGIVMAGLGLDADVRIDTVRAVLDLALAAC